MNYNQKVWQTELLTEGIMQPSISMDVLLQSRLTDCLQVKAKRVAHIVTATYSNLSQVAHEISFYWGASKGSKLEEELYMDVSFLQLPSHMFWFRQECWCWYLHFILPPLLFQFQVFVQHNFVGLRVSVHGCWNR